jgi:hypothetical protein
MPRAKKPASTAQPNLLDVSATLRTAPCVPAIRQEVEQWRQAGCPGITATTQRLLAWWFKNDHRMPRGTAFRYYDSQREAIETLVYLYEVKQLRRCGQLLTTYAKGQKIALPARDEFARYALKMATGSGKTKVMAMAWQYFNAVRESGADYATTFLLLAPKIEQFLRDKAFGQTVELESKLVLQALNRPVVLNFTVRVFLKLLRPYLTEEREPVLDGEVRKLSATAPFPWSGRVAEIRKTLFNLMPCDNEFEQHFANFLDASNDLAALANVGNLPQKLSLEYLDNEANLRCYEPDFVARDDGGGHWLIETKGREDLDVARKDERAERWCADVTALTGRRWRYLKVPQREFVKFRPGSFAELVSGLTAGGPWLLSE